ncbi:MAG: V4R domain-containing protein [Thermoplasmata archaeon]
MKKEAEAIQLEFDAEKAEILVNGVPFLMLRKDVVGCMWKALSRTAGQGAAALLYQAGREAGLSNCDFLVDIWEPKDEEEFFTAMTRHFRSTGLFSLDHVKIDRTEGTATVRVTNNFETIPFEGSAETPVCHFLRGLLCGIMEKVLQEEDLICDEMKCQAKGDDRCEIVISQTFQRKRQGRS